MRKYFGKYLIWYFISFVFLVVSLVLSFLLNPPHKYSQIFYLIAATINVIIAMKRLYWDNE